MDFSAVNTSLWSPIISFGAIAAILLVSNFLLRKIGFLRRMLIPTAVLAGFITLGLKYLGVLDFITPTFLETITYHGIAIGFIAMSLRVPNQSEEFKRSGTAVRSGAVIISTYLVQAMAGLTVSILLMRDIFPAAGVLLPMGYGQGPGQANNVGTTYEANGFVGGRSFGLSIAAAGYLCACTVGLIIIFILRARGKIARSKSDFVTGLSSVDTFEDQHEIPISQSIDRFTIQAALVLMVYLLTYLATWGVTAGISKVAPGLGNTVNSLLWGFNFVTGSALAMLVRTIFQGCRKTGIMKRQYPNNYLLSRLSGFAFDIMIICGIAAIDISDLKGLWVPFVAMTVLGCIATAIHLAIVSKRVYKGYALEGFLSMFGMLTGTISSGIVLLREADPEFDTPAANNLVTGSSVGILFGAPVLLLVGIAYQPGKLPLTCILVVLYFFVLMAVVWLRGKKKTTTEAVSDGTEAESAEGAEATEAIAAEAVEATVSEASVE